MHECIITISQPNKCCSQYTIIIDSANNLVRYNKCLSAGLIASINIIPIGVVLSCCDIWCTMRCGRGHATESQGQKLEQPEEAIYDEPLETGIDIGDNQAYGHMNDNKENL